MNWSRTSRFRPSGVSGFPTWWGGLMFALVGGALFYSMSGQAPVEQWIALLMIIIILIQLVEISLPFRGLEISVLPFIAPFADETFPYILEVSNAKQTPTDAIYFRLNTKDAWTKIPGLPPLGRAHVALTAPALSAGQHLLPTIRMKTRARSELFQLWRRVRFDQKFVVLPAPHDHGVPIARAAPEAGSTELSHLESIKDERLMFLMDQKIFLKTGKPYYRVMEEIRVDEKISLDWAQMSDLPFAHQGEQFSQWLKSLRRTTGAAQIHIDAPFFKYQAPLKSIDWLALHESFAEWFHAES